VQECRLRAPCPTGEARITKGYKLRAKNVIHAVGPVWRGGTSGEPELLASCYQNALRIAWERAFATIAFPGISTGIYGYPLDAATEIAVRTCREANTDAELIRFVCFDAQTLETYQRKLAR